MHEKEDLLKTLGYSEELLKYFQCSQIEEQLINNQVMELSVTESYDLPHIPNLDQNEVVSTSFTFI